MLNWKSGQISVDDIIKNQRSESTVKKIKNYDNVFKQTILKLDENGKSLKELSREYGVST